MAGHSPTGKWRSAADGVNRRTKWVRVNTDINDEQGQVQPLSAFDEAHPFPVRIGAGPDEHGYKLDEVEPMEPA